MLCLCVVPGGELFDYVYKLDHLPEAEAAYYTQQLASFLAYAHSKLIIHRCVSLWRRILWEALYCGFCLWMKTLVMRFWQCF